jgi:apolipoprotein N-acyltransferase
VGAGILLALSLPPWGWWPLAFVGSGLLFWRLHHLSLRWRLLSGWCAGLGCYGLGLFWARSFNWYGALALIVLEAFSMAAAAMMTPPGSEGQDWRQGHAQVGRLVSYVGAFTLMEAVRMSWPFGGLPIGGVYLGQAAGPLLDAARLGGPLLLTALVWATGAGLAQGAMSIRGGGNTRLLPARTRVMTGALTIIVVVVVGLVGWGAPNGGPAEKHLRVAAVQGGGKRGFSKEEVDPDTVFAAQLAATKKMARQLHERVPPLVVWPEDVISIAGRLQGSPEAALMSTLSRELNTTIVAGVTSQTTLTSFRNEIVVWGPNGQIVDRFEKVHRVPFGEYVPYRSVISHLANLSAVPLDAVPGHGSGLLRTPVGPLGVMVSYEVFYANRSLSSVRAGAQLLLVPTNTSSYATAQIPTQEVAADRVQAVSTGRDLVQAAPTGYSTVVNSSGLVRQRSILGARQVLIDTVALRTGRTIYVDTGDWPVLVVGAVLVGLGWWLQFLGRRRRRPTVNDPPPSSTAAADLPAPPVQS